MAPGFPVFKSTSICLLTYGCCIVVHAPKGCSCWSSLCDVSSQERAFSRLGPAEAVVVCTTAEWSSVASQIHCDHTMSDEAPPPGIAGNTLCGCLSALYKRLVQLSHLLQCNL